MINTNFLLTSLGFFLIIIIYFNIQIIERWFRKLLPESNEGKYVKICPKCGSTNVVTDFSNPAVWAYGTTTKYRCKDCKYMANIFPEVLKDNIQKYKEEVGKGIKKGKINLKSELIDTSTGFYVGIWEIIFALIQIPFLILSLIFYEDFDLFWIILILWVSLCLYVGLKLIKRRKNKVQ